MKDIPYNIISISTILATLLSPALSEAQDTTVITSIRSYHLDREKDFNEWNYGLGVKFETDSLPVNLEAGIYYNSRSRPSVYITATKEYGNEVAGLSLGTGFVSGYARFPVPMMVVSGYISGIRIGFLPAPKGNSALFLQLKYDI
jgi:hypothetical protein